MIFDKPNVNFTDEEWIEIIKEYLNGWTEIPLNPSNGYDIDELKFYDGLLGTLLKDTEFFIKNDPTLVNKKFVGSWKYQGKLYRVIHPHYVFDNDDYMHPRIVMPDVEYHGMISHWTDDYTFKGLMYKLFDDVEYIILETDTKDRLAFDVNKFRKKHNCRKWNTEKEREIIFPMYRENTKEYRMTINEFMEIKKKERKS